MKRTFATITTFTAVAALLTAGASPAVASTATGGATAGATGGGSQITLGQGGFIVRTSPASTWVAQNPNDPRTPVINARIAQRPSAMWLTSPTGYGNLDSAVAQARANDGTVTVVLYYLPGRSDGPTGSADTTSAAYRAYVDHVSAAIGSTRAVVVVEPDALWFVDRQTPPGTAAYTQRMSLLNYAVDTFRSVAPRSDLYLEAGTSSGSVTGSRMAQLLQAAGVARAAGFAVNVSSFAPTQPITAWAQSIRAGLRDLGMRPAHYVVDTSRNGNPSWHYSWCNPPDREVGVTPGLASGRGGLDANLWVKQPGTSDGSCGVGSGSSGGQFLPQVAYDMVT